MRHAFHILAQDKRPPTSSASPVFSQETSHEPHAIQTLGMGKVYPNGQRALAEVDFNLGSHQICTVIGPSGAGKSTFLRCLNRLIDPSEGTIKLYERDITKASGRQLNRIRQRIGMVFQQFNLVPRLSVLNNVLAGRLRFNNGPLRYCLSTFHVFPKQEREIAFECLRSVGIAHLAFRRADTLSGGQQQRVAIARTLAQEPDVVLADEPVASLDPFSGDRVMEILHGISSDKRIPVIVSVHQIDFARRYGKRVVGFAHGRIMFDGKAADLDKGTLENIYRN